MNFKKEDMGYVSISVSVDIDYLVESSIEDMSINEEILQAHKSKIEDMVEYERHEYRHEDERYEISAGYDYVDFENQKVEVYVSIMHYLDIPEPLEGESTLVHEGQVTMEEVLENEE